MSSSIGLTTSRSFAAIPTGTVDRLASAGASRAGSSQVAGVQSQGSLELDPAAIAHFNGALAQNEWKLEFVVDKSIDQLLVKVVDTQTNEVLAQVPAESMLATARALADGARVGVLLDEQA